MLNIQAQHFQVESSQSNQDLFIQYLVKVHLQLVGNFKFASKYCCK